MNIFKKLALKLKLIKPKQNWFKKFFKSFKSLFRLKSRKSRFFVGLFVVLALGASFFIVYSQNSNNSDGEVSLSKGLVAHWPLNEINYNFTTSRVTDKTPYVNHGTNYGATFTEDRFGKEGGAMSFDGVNDYIQFSEDTTTESFSLWIDFTNITTVSYFFGSQTVNGRGVRYNGSTLLLYGSIGHQAITYDFEDGYVHLVGVKNNNDWNVYNNGEYIGTFTGVGSLGIGYIGRRNDGYYFNGKIDDVRIYDRALSEEEISLLYDSYQPKVKVSSINAGLIGHWSLSAEDYNSTTNRVTDKTPYENHGTNYGASFTKDRHEKEGGAMSFDGNDYINIGVGNDYFPLPLFSFCSWVKSPGLASGMTVNGIFTLTYGLRFNINSVGNFWTSIDNGSTFVSLTDTTTNLYDGNFHHLCLTYDGVDRHMFVDGVKKISAATVWPGVTRWPTNGARIGQDINHGARYSFNGQISDFRIYNRALSEEEIKLLFDSYNPQSGGNSLQKGLVLDMPLTSEYTKSSASGSEIMTDRTPHSNDGQNYGGVVDADGTLLSNTGDRIETSFSVPNNEGTISIWYKPLHGTSDPGRNSVLYSTGAAWTNNSFEYALRNCCGRPYDNILYMQADNTNRLSFEWDEPVWAANEWVHLTVVYSSKNFIRAYMNGDLVASRTGGNNTNFNFPAKFNIGAKNSSSISAKGTVSSLKVYDRILSDDEISLIYDKEIFSFGGVKATY